LKAAVFLALFVCDFFEVIMTKANAPLLSMVELSLFLKREFPQIGIGHDFIIEDVGVMSARLRLAYDVKHLRPGGTMSGPAMFALADVAIWVAILGQVGKVPLIVTTNLNINFFRMPPPKDLIAQVRILKLGKRLAVGEAVLSSVDSDEAVAHAIATYSVPPKS
jgi:uncharacterized protein (TIGR00369 family)